MSGIAFLNLRGSGKLSGLFHQDLTDHTILKINHLVENYFPKIITTASSILSTR